MGMIKNFGHFWSRNHVQWGTRGKGNQGHLRGFKRDERTFVANFRSQIAVYVLFDRNREAVYLGQTGGRETDRLFDRLKAHTRDHLRDRWDYFSWFGVRQTTNTGDLHEGQSHESRPLVKDNAVALDEFESILLQLFEPRLNKQGPAWKSLDVEEYLQFVEEEEDQLAIVISRLDELEGAVSKGLRAG
jgi:hypothetical protein